VLAQASVGNFNLHDGPVTNSKMVNPVFSARLGADGTAERLVGVDRSQTRRIGTGRYEVTFERPVDNCVITAQIRGSSPGLTDTIQVEDPTSSRPNTVSITTQAAVVPSTGNPGTSPILSVSVDRRFDLIAAC
jgi:hypothetical protein